MTDNNNSIKFKLTPKEYKDKLGSVELKNIFLDSFSATVRRDKLSSTMKTNITDSRKYEIHENGDVVFVHSFDLVNTSSSKKEYAVKINCSYSLCFSSNVPLNNDFWDIFSQVNLHINTWPYFREFVQSTTQRMSVHSLTLPLLKK